MRRFFALIGGISTFGFLNHPYCFSLRSIELWFNKGQRVVIWAYNDEQCVEVFSGRVYESDFKFDEFLSYETAYFFTVVDYGVRGAIVLEVLQDEWICFETNFKEKVIYA